MYIFWKIIRKWKKSAKNYFQALNDLAALYQEKYINELKTKIDNLIELASLGGESAKAVHNKIEKIQQEIIENNKIKEELEASKAE